MALPGCPVGVFSHFCDPGSWWQLYTLACRCLCTDSGKLTLGQRLQSGNSWTGQSPPIYFACPTQCLFIFWISSFKLCNFTRFQLLLKQKKLWQSRVASPHVSQQLELRNHSTLYTCILSLFYHSLHHSLLSDTRSSTLTYLIIWPLLAFAFEASVYGNGIDSNRSYLAPRRMNALEQ